MRVRVLLRVAAISIVGVPIVPAVASADAGQVRHPGPGAIAPPAGVPSSYVFTHSGWFHPSCVVRVGEDEAVGADLVVRGRADGAARFSFAPCAHARFDLHGRAMAEGAPGHLPPEAAPPAPAVYDGYIVYYQFSGSITPGSTLVTDELVPPPPSNVANQDIAFFNDILTNAGGGDILQPVLDFNGETTGKWSIESEHCCLSGNDMQTTPVVVAPGDLIKGTVTGTGCATSGVCSAWAVTTADMTTGKSTTLNTTAPNGVPNGVSPGSLETYGVMACDMFPGGGVTTFTNNTLTDPAGNVQTLKYRLINFQGVNAEVPTNCGYNGSTSGNDFTLVYGQVAPGADGGAGAGGGADGGGAAGASGVGGHAGSGGSASDAGAGGHAGSGGSASDAGTGSAATGGSSGRVDASGTGGAGAGGTGAGGVSGTGGSKGAGTGGAGAGSMAGNAGGSTGAPGAGAASDGASGGCGCDVSASHAPGLAAVLLLSVAAILGARRRRRAAPSERRR